MGFSFLLALLMLPASPIVLVAPQPTWEQQDITLLARCESEGSTTVTVLDTNDRYSFGLLQFQRATWNKYSFLGTTPGNILDPSLQQKVATYILDNATSTGGLWNWKNCADKNGLL